MCILVVGGLWLIGSNRDPVEITYCFNRVDNNTPNYRCLEYKTLKIPRTYYGDGYQLNFGDREGEHISYLEVAYPSMKPWQSIPWRERKNTQKIELQLRGLSNHHLVGENMETYTVVSRPQAILRADTLLGLKAYDQDDNLILLPPEKKPRVGIWCANGQYPARPASGYCWTKSHTNWGLNLYLNHQQALLPQWQQINTETIALVNSFAINSEPLKLKSN